MPVQEIASTDILREHDHRATMRQTTLRTFHADTVRAATAPGVSAAGGKGNSVVPAIELRVDTNGLYRVTYEDLAAAED